MAWRVLIVSATLEAVWATALGKADGVSQPLPTTVFAIALTISMLGLGWAAKHISIGTAYAVWVGIWGRFDCHARHPPLAETIPFE